MSTAVLLLTLTVGAPPLLLSPAELADRLADPALVVLHVEDRDGDFAAGHLPGARPIRYREIAVDGPNALGSELPPLDVLRGVFQAVGVGASSRVVVYGSALAATRAFFTLEYLGHPDVRLLNGGLPAWRAAGRPVASGPPTTLRPGPGTLARLTPNPQVLAEADWLLARLQSPRMTLIDARPDAEYTGDDGGMGGMHPAGHLAGARQLVWTDLVGRSSQFVPDADLRARFDAAGARPGVPIVSYCMVGMRASVIYFVARHLGYDARMYDGSIVDWGRRKLPVQTGR